MENNIDQFEEEAINAAIKTKWRDAIIVNKKITRLDKKNVYAFLRLGFAYLQLNMIREAKKHYKKALKLQPGNQIASQNLERINILEQKKIAHNDNKKIFFDPNLFLEIQGKTKSINLVNLGQKDILAQLTIGQEVILKPKRRKIEIMTKDRDYIGSLPDDISKRLIIFIISGSKYTCVIKEPNINKVVIFIKEEKKGKKVTRYSSFPQNIQNNLNKMTEEDELKETSDEESTENDLYKLAENITT